MFNWFKSTKKATQPTPTQAALSDNPSSDEALAFLKETDAATETQRQRALAQIKDSQTLQQLAIEQPALTAAIATRLSDNNSDWLTGITAEFRDLLLSRHDTDAELKAMLIAAIDDKQHAKALIQRIQDKKSQQLLRDKLKTLTQFEKDNKALFEAAEHLLHKLDVLAPLPWDSIYSGKITKIERDWNALDTDKLSDSIKAHYATLHEICQTTVAAHAEEHAKQQTEQAIKDKQHDCIEQLSDHINVLQTKPSTELAVTNRLIETVSAQWDAASTELKPSLSVETQYTQALAKLTQYQSAQAAATATELNQYRQLLDAQDAAASIDDAVSALSEGLSAAPWPDFTSLSEQRQSAQTLLDKLKQLQKAIHKTQAKHLSHIRHKNRELGQKLNDKNLIAASRLNYYIEQKIQELPEKWQSEAREITQKNLQALEQLEALNAFATEPKKIQLCEQMEALIADKALAETPEALANQIQALQNEWKKTNTIVKDDDPLWTRFTEAAHKAWEPCAAHYQGEQDKREANVAKRQALCEQIQTFIDTQDWASINSADWKAVIDLEKTARAEFSSFEPVDYKLNRPVQKTFYALIDILKDKIKAQQAVFLADKDDLISRAEQLSEEELDKAIEQAKFLQQRWKATPTLRIGEDRKHWKRFQAACNAVFERLGEKRDAEKAERQQIIEQAEKIINDIYALGKSADDTLAKSRDEFDTLKAAYDALDEMPEQVSKRKHNDFRKACDFYEKQVDGLASKKQAEVHNTLYQLSLLLNEHDSAPTEALVTRIQDHIETLNASSLKSQLAPIQARFEADTVDAQTQQDNISALETLAIEYEILANIDTPEAYKSQRMAYQLAQLQKGLGKQATQNASEQLLALDLAWAALALNDESTRAPLEARRLAAREAH